MTKKIIVFTLSESQSKYEVGRLKKEAKKAGVELKHYLYKEIEFRFANEGWEIYLRGKKIKPKEYSGVWFRVAGTKSGKYISARNSLIRMFKKKKVFCVNWKSYLNWERMDKIKQHGVYVTNGIPIVETRVFYAKEQVMKANFDFPIICKHGGGFQGKSVKKVENMEELLALLDTIGEKNLGMYLWQAFLPVGWDIRVVIVNGKAIGGMRRIAVGDEFRSNFSLGGKVENWQLSKEEKELAERTAKVCGLNYGGVDIMKDKKNNNYILEINRACQYKGFEKATRINVAGKVLEMLQNN